MIEILNNIAEYNDCEDDLRCNVSPDYQRCKFCRAQHLLDEIAEMLRPELRSILKSKTYGGREI